MGELLVLLRAAAAELHVLAELALRQLALTRLDASANKGAISLSDDSGEK